MSKQGMFVLLPSLLILLSGLATPAHGNLSLFNQQIPSAFILAGANSDREQDGLIGPVRRVRTETAKITTKGGQPSEGARAVLETTTYDIKGGKVDTAYFLTASGALTGKENYKYDDKGNIVEMTLHDTDGSVLTKEVYAYEFDAVGNWTKMTTSVAVIEGGKVTHEPTEVTYRSIAYYLEENVAKMAQPAASIGDTPNAGVTAPAITPSIVSAANKTNQPVKSVAATVTKSSAQRTSNKAAALPTVTALNKVNVQPASLSSINAPAAAVSSNQSASVAVEGDAPSRPMMRGPLKPVSGGLLNGRATNLPMPVYPEIAKRARTTGMVTVEVVIDATGKVIAAKAVSGPSMLHQAAERAATQARFSPTLLSGQPVKVAGVINYNFALSQ
ncbi:MAG TPA: TonB family protein [Pyrinomonadaceae bacterium]|jgi:protein TonB|nr:TonB family protein [Pyrinomonadaceae bacterium]